MANDTADEARLGKRKNRTLDQGMLDQDAFHQNELDRGTRSTVAKTAGAMIIATLVLGVFNSDGLRSYARDLQPSDLNDRIVRAADAWHELMQRAGFTQPKRIVRDLMERFRES